MGMAKSFEQPGDITFDEARRLRDKTTPFPMLEQLRQLTEATWDGNLISKDATRRLVEHGWADKVEGWNIATKEGLEVLIKLGILKA